MFRMPTNRKLNPQNSKVVKTATETIKTTAAIAQEKYWNAFRVNGYTCNVYNILKQGKICSCSKVDKRNVMKPILDENGNAPKDVITSLLDGGMENGIFDYGTSLGDPMSSSVTIKTLNTKKALPKTSFNTDLSSPDQDFIDEDFNEDDIEPDLSNGTTNKCGICYGSGYVGGYNLCFGNRYVLDSTWDNIKYYGYSVQQEQVPNTIRQSAPDIGAYIEFTVTLPFSIYKVSSLRLLNNFDVIHGNITASLDGQTFEVLTDSNIINYCKGVPVFIRVSDTKIFTHLEIEFLLTEEDTYLEYPKITQTGDITVINDVADVVIYVSPKVPLIRAQDIIVDNTLGKVWRVLNVNDHKDRNYNIHGWEVNARIIQPYELYSNMPSNKTSQHFLTVNLNRT